MASSFPLLARVARLAAAACIACGLAACSGTLIEGKKIDYKSAGKGRGLNVPVDLSVPPTSDRYSIPEVKQGTSTFSEYAEGHGKPNKEAGGAVLPRLERMRLVRAGSQRWLNVDAEPAELWPAVRDFWQETGFLIDREMPESGIMETDWAENRAKIQGGIRSLIGKLFDFAYSYPERDRFRTRMERNAEGGGTDIFISHRGMYEVLIREGRREETKWQVRPSDPELEAEMLSRLMTRLAGGDPDKDKPSVALDRSPQEPRARITRKDGKTEVLQVDDEFDRAWRRVGLALDRVGFTVVDRDRSKGLYFVRYVDPDIEKKSDSFWSRMFGGKKDGDKDADQYRISVSDAQKGSEVAVLDGKGAPSPAPTANRILALLQQELK